MEMALKRELNMEQSVKYSSIVHIYINFLQNVQKSVLLIAHAYFLWKVNSRLFIFCEGGRVGRFASLQALRRKLPKA